MLTVSILALFGAAAAMAARIVHFKDRVLVYEDPFRNQEDSSLLSEVLTDLDPDESLNRKGAGARRRDDTIRDVSKAA